MNRPAVPDYVTRDAEGFSDCPPGHRFALYFPIWQADWRLDTDGEIRELSKILEFGSAMTVLDALIGRQKMLAEAIPTDDCLVMDAISIAPFATGLGLEHPIKNGFAFLSPYGLPCLAGSSVKGVLRNAAQELEEDADIVRALFGPRTDEIRKPEDAFRGALTCWDVFPVPPDKGPRKNSMSVEIMTPHGSDYYQGKTSPHDSGKPNPIPFLAMPTQSRFRFVVTCDSSLLKDAMAPGLWKVQLEKIMKHAFEWLGFGAKTAVGYGAMTHDREAEDRRARERMERETEARAAEQERLRAEQRQSELERLSPLERNLHEFLDQRPDKNQPEISAVIGAVKEGRWQGEDKVAVAQWLESRMRNTKGRWKETSQARNPQKDKDYQNTVLVKSWLGG